jgi:hypothetical protein
MKDDMKPAVVIGEFVKVKGDTSPGNNRPCVIGFVESVQGVGAATTATVRYQGVENRKYSHIPLSALTSLVFGSMYGIVEATKRNIQAIPIVSPPKKNETDKRPRIERFLEELKFGAQYNKTRGWHRLRHYPNQSKLPLSTKMPRQLSPTERQQLWGEINLLEAHLLYCPHRKSKKDATSGKFVEQKVNPLTLDFLVQQAWGMSKLFSSRFRKQMDEAEAMQDSKNRLLFW